MSKNMYSVGWTVYHSVLNQLEGKEPDVVFKMGLEGTIAGNLAYGSFKISTKCNSHFQDLESFWNEHSFLLNLEEGSVECVDAEFEDDINTLDILREKLRAEAVSLTFNLYHSELKAA